jgi:hypothetical protein
MWEPQGSSGSGAAPLRVGTEGTPGRATAIREAAGMSGTAHALRIVPVRARIPKVRRCCVRNAGRTQKPVRSMADLGAGARDAAWRRALVSVAEQPFYRLKRLESWAASSLIVEAALGVVIARAGDRSCEVGAKV